MTDTTLPCGCVIDEYQTLVSCGDPSHSPHSPEAAPPAALDWAQRAIDRMLRAADTETRYWIEGIVKEERARLTEKEDTRT